MSCDGKVFIDPSQVDGLVPTRDLHVSYSQVKTYLLCPERYRQQYVCARRPSHRSAELVLGSALHAVLATHHEHLRQYGEPMSLAILHDELDRLLDAWFRAPVPILWADDEAPEKLKSQARSLLTLYYDEVTVHRVLAVEQRFSVPSSEWPAGERRPEKLVGVVDLIEGDVDGRVWVTELKTAARKFDNNRLAFDPQLGLYAGARATLGVPEARLRYRVLLKTKKPAIVTYEVLRAEGDIEEAFELVSAVMHAVEQRAFYRQRGWQCDTCPYRSTCGA